MPPPVTRPGGRFRRYLIVSLLLLAGTSAYAFVHLGNWLASPDQPVTQADAIFVLAGTVAERPLEAADLYQAGVAPSILLTREFTDSATRVAIARGATVPSSYDLTRTMLLELGIPVTALIVPDRQHDSTSAEAETLRQVAVSRGWKRVIVVSSKYHLRRAAIACRRQLRGTGITLVFHATKYDVAVPGRWWTRRSDIRWVVSELPKLLAYAIGLGA